jgi:hypothetical protein
MRRPEDRVMCETSEMNERLSREDIVPVSVEIGRRIMEVFGYQAIPKIVFRLKSKSRQVRDVIEGNELPSIELLLAIQAVTHASIDWLLTGKGPKYMPTDASTERKSRYGRVPRRAPRPHRITPSIQLTKSYGKI